MNTKRPRRPPNAKRLQKTQLALYVEPEAAEALKELSERTRVPQQVYLREGLDAILAKYAIKRERRPGGNVHTLVRKESKR
jgi:hypothetical protein